MDVKKNVRRKLSAIAVLVATPFYVSCALNHLCMAGHMRHPPYHFWDHLGDGVWVVCFVLAIVLSLQSNLRLRRAFFGVTIFLIASRLLMGSGGGLFFLLELPALIFLIIVAIVSLIRPERDWSKATDDERKRHEDTVIRRLGIVAVIIGLIAIMSWAGYHIYWQILRSAAERIVVAENVLPFKTEVRLKKGEAARLILPNGKEIAFWCREGTFLDDADLGLTWGEVPYERLSTKWFPQPDGSAVAAEWHSYIRQGCVTTWSGGPGHEYELFVEKYRVTLREEGPLSGTLPVKVCVRHATEKEMLYGDAEREHYLKALESDDPKKRINAIKELYQMVAMGSIYTGAPKDMISAIKPLAKDPDPKVRIEAENALCGLGDEKALLALITPKPQGEWSGAKGGLSVGFWNREQSNQRVSEQVLSFLKSSDMDLQLFAIAYFSQVEYAPAKDYLLKAFDHESPEVRSLAIDILFLYCNPPEASRYISRSLDESNKAVLDKALRETGRYIQYIPIEKIIKHLQHDDPEIRKMAAYALDCCLLPEIVDPLLEATKDQDPGVRAQAAVSLGRIGAPKAFNRLVELLGDSDADVRDSTINGLRWFGDLRAIPHIKNLLKTEKNESVRAMANRTIRELK